MDTCNGRMINTPGPLTRCDTCRGAGTADQNEGDRCTRPARNRYEEKQEAKRERLLARADKARAESTTRYAAARRTMDGIPMGQPILVGHHSEKRHRKDIARIDANLRKSFEAADYAAELERRAAAVGTGGISQDDPEAVLKLKRELVQRRFTRDAELFWNKEVARLAKQRAKDKGAALTQSDHVAIIESLLMPEALKQGMLRYARAFPWLPKFGTGTAADIRRIEKRIAELEAKAAMPEREPLTGTVLDHTGKPTGYTIEWNKADNRVQIYTPFKPCDAVIKRLVARGFRWARSLGVWQRHASEGAWYAAKECVGHKDAAPSHCVGCDNDDRPTKPYDVTFTSGATERCNYCDDCAGLAAMNYNGETQAIKPASDKESCHG